MDTKFLIVGDDRLYLLRAVNRDCVNNMTKIEKLNSLLESKPAKIRFVKDPSVNNKSAKINRLNKLLEKKEAQGRMNRQGRRGYVPPSETWQDEYLSGGGLSGQYGGNSPLYGAGGGAGGIGGGGGGGQYGTFTTTTSPSTASLNVDQQMSDAFQAAMYGVSISQAQQTVYEAEIEKKKRLDFLAQLAESQQDKIQITRLID